MKKSIGIITLCFACLLLSCSQASDEIQEETQTNLLSLREQAKLIVASTLTLQAEFDGTADRTPALEEFDQATLDDYAEMLGIESMPIEEFENLLSAVPDIYATGVLASIEALPYNSFTKNQLEVLTQGNTIEMLEQMPEFNNLPIQEKELLMLGNYVVEEFGDTEMLRISDIPCPSTGCGLGFGLLLGSMGGAACGPPCAVGGFVIGMIIGTAGKNQ